RQSRTLRRTIAPESRRQTQPIRSCLAWAGELRDWLLCRHIRRRLLPGYPAPSDGRLRSTAGKFRSEQFVSHRSSRNLQSNQNDSFSASCTRRWKLVWLFGRTPNTGLVKVVLCGPPRIGVLVRLKDSARNCSL